MIVAILAVEETSGSILWVDGVQAVSTVDIFGITIVGDLTVEETSGSQFLEL